MSIDVYPSPVDVILGTMATQNANAVAITGGTVAGLAGFSMEGNTRSIYPNAFNALDQSGDNLSGLYSTINAAGGTNRWGVYHIGDAPSYFGGHVVVPASKTLRLGTATPTPAYGSRAEVYFTSAVVGIQFRPDSDLTAYASAFRNAADALVGSIITTATATAYNTSSDARLKYAITPLTGALDVVRALQPIRHFWQSDYSRGTGFLAETLQRAIPEAVTGDPYAVDKEGNLQPQQVDNSKIVPYLTAAIHELLARIEALEAQLA